MNKSEFLSLLCTLEGFKVKFREFHWNTNLLSEHKLCDSVMDSIVDFQDNFAEDSNRYSNLPFSVFTFQESAISETKTAIPVSEIKNRHKDLSALQDNIDQRLIEAIRQT